MMRDLTEQYTKACIALLEAERQLKEAQKEFDRLREIIDAANANQLPLFDREDNCLDGDCYMTEMDVMS